MRDAMPHEMLLGLTDQELLKLAPQAEYQHYNGGLYANAIIDDINYIVTYEHVYPYSQLYHQKSLEKFNGHVTLSSERPFVLFCHDTHEVGDVVPRFRKLHKGD